MLQNRLIQDAFVVGAVEDTKAQYLEVEVLGAFYLKPNFLVRCSHICNAGFIVQPVLGGQSNRVSIIAVMYRVLA